MPTRVCLYRQVCILWLSDNTNHMPQGFPFCLSCQETYSQTGAQPQKSTQLFFVPLWCSCFMFYLTHILIALDTSGASEVDRIKVTNLKKSTCCHPGINMHLGQGTPCPVLTDWPHHGSGMGLCKVCWGHLAVLNPSLSSCLSLVPLDHVKT